MCINTHLDQFLALTTVSTYTVSIFKSKFYFCNLQLSNNTETDVY